MNFGSIGPKGFQIHRCRCIEGAKIIKQGSENNHKYKHLLSLLLYDAIVLFDHASNLILFQLSVVILFSLPTLQL